MSVLLPLLLVCGVDLDLGAKLEQSFVEQRKLIHSGDLQLAFVVRAGGKKQLAKQRIVFDKNRMRLDNHHFTGQSDQAVTTPAGYVLYRSGYKNSRYPVHTGDAQSAKRKYVNISKANPLAIGLVPACPGHWHGHNVDTMLASKNRSKEHVRKVEVDGVDGYQISYQRKDGSRVRLVLAPKLGYSLIAGSIETPSGDKDATRVEVRDHGNGIFFPSRVEWTRENHGKIVSEWTVTIKAKLNTNLDEKAFTLAGINPPAGTPIQDIRATGVRSLQWDGKRIVE